MNTRPLLWLAGSLVAIAGCDAALDTIEPITQAITAEDTASSDEATVDDGSADVDDADDGDCERRRGDRGIAPPDGFDDVEIEACALPLAEGVDAGRRPHHRGHLAPLYDADESRFLDDTERATLIADVGAGCAARTAGLLADFDTDVDGVLSQDEWDAARAAHRATRDAERASIDTDANGEVSDVEHEAARAALIATWDVDGSGDLDETERATMRTDLQALVRAGEPLPPLPLLGPPGGHRRGGRHGPPPGDDVDVDAEATSDG